MGRTTYYGPHYSLWAALLSMGHLALLLALDHDLYSLWAALLTMGRSTYYGPHHSLWATLHFSLLSTTTSTHFGPHYSLWAALLTMGHLALFLALDHDFLLHYHARSRSPMHHLLLLRASAALPVS